MNAYFKGQPVFGPRGPAGPDGNPIGTIISYMGLTAPKDYLICDGAEYSISDYPELAAFFAEQFESANHFGGDGTTTFAVPDLRNLFLRGYRGEAEAALSRDVGARQEGTVFPALFAVGGKSGRAPSVMTDVPSAYTQSFEHPDTCEGSPASYTYCSIPWVSNTISESGADIYASSYTARPVNMAVLFCIKAVESVPAENVYSTEETRIGTWIDGKPLYRKTVNVISPANDGAAKVGDLSADVSMVRIYGYLYQDGESCLPIPFFDGTNRAWLYAEAHSFYIGVSSTYFRSKPVAVILEYTKTTD